MDQSLLDRFWSRVDKRGENDCWPWLRSRNCEGYGNYAFKTKSRKAHRFAWEIKNGPIPSGMWICHKCDNPPCCNPDHLFMGTHADNSRDMKEKGRGCGRKTKFLQQEARMELSKFVLEKRKAHGWSQEDLGNRALVTRMTIFRLESGENIIFATVVKILAALGYALEPVKIEGWEP